MSIRRTGYALIHKEEGLTSFQTISYLKKNNKKIKIGHTGTLDKFAEGLLVVLFGGFTKLSNYFIKLDKTYLAEIMFGIETDTLDPTGTPIAYGSIPTADIIKTEAAKFIGKINQIPPAYSAVHIEGKRAYQLAIKGETPNLHTKLPNRSITIYSLEILDWKLPKVIFKISCSSGTYIRSFAKDLGIACKSRAHVTKLTRLSVGNYHLEKAIKIKCFDSYKDIITGTDAFNMLNDFSILRVDNNIKAKILKGIPLQKKWLPFDFEKDYGALFDNEDTLLGVISKNTEKQHYDYFFVINTG